MKKIVAFSGSNNPNSINEQLLIAALSKIPKENAHLIRLVDYPVPIYNWEIEERGIPESVKNLYQKFTEADGFLIASPEHNGLPTAFFKNIIDWLSRIDQKFFGYKPVLLISTSPGSSGGAPHLQILIELMPRWGGRLSGTYSLGEFNKKFDREKQVIKETFEDIRLTTVIQDFINANSESMSNKYII